MQSFETILTHLGPSSAPLMVFLNSTDAKRLLITSKYVGSRVSAYADRWGFKLAPYVEWPDGSFTLTTSNGSKRFPPLKKWQDISYLKSPAYLRKYFPDKLHEICIVGNQVTKPILVGGTYEEIKAILKEAEPYLASRRKRLCII
jgi:hypothetical protein